MSRTTLCFHSEVCHHREVITLFYRWMTDGVHEMHQDVYYIVRNQANKKEKISILHGVSGYFNPGEMAAVMGPSGSGMSRPIFYSFLR